MPPRLIHAAAAALACVALLGACAASRLTASSTTIPKYEPPDGVSVARLVMRGIVPGGDAYVVRVLDDQERCAGARMVGSGNAVQHPDSTTLAAGRPVTIDFDVIKASNQACASRWTFTPVAGKAYLLTGFGANAGCFSVVTDMSDAEHLKPEPSALNRSPPGSNCVPVAQAKPLPLAAAASAASAGEATLRDGAFTSDLQGLGAP